VHLLAQGLADAERPSRLVGGHGYIGAGHHHGQRLAYVADK
jgi:hypothetical protein